MQLREKLRELFLKAEHKCACLTPSYHGLSKLSKFLIKFCSRGHAAGFTRVVEVARRPNDQARLAYIELVKK